jgi:hypothetical protein
MEPVATQNAVLRHSTTRSNAARHVATQAPLKPALPRTCRSRRSGRRSCRSASAPAAPRCTRCARAAWRATWPAPSTPRAGPAAWAARPGELRFRAFRSRWDPRAISRGPLMLPAPIVRPLKSIAKSCAAYVEARVRERACARARARPHARPRARAAGVRARAWCACVTGRAYMQACGDEERGVRRSAYVVHG